MATQELLEYIRAELQKGTDSAVITTYLTDNGWALVDIQEALSLVQSSILSSALPVSTSVVNSQIIPSHTNNWLYITLGLLLLLIIGGSSYYIFTMQKHNFDNTITQMLPTPTPPIPTLSPTPILTIATPTISITNDMYTGWKTFQDSGNPTYYGTYNMYLNNGVSFKLPTDWNIDNQTNIGKGQIDFYSPHNISQEGFHYYTRGTQTIDSQANVILSNEGCLITHDYKTVTFNRNPFRKISCVYKSRNDNSTYSATSYLFISHKTSKLIELYFLIDNPALSNIESLVMASINY